MKDDGESMRKFDRGSYGEVWLAFRWNCSDESGGSNHSPTNLTNAASHLHSDEQKSRRHPNSSSKHNFTESGDDNYFILKRIMVERGNTAYLSGLREKYFGELFLNASISLDRNGEPGLLTTLSSGVEYDSSCLLGTVNTSSPMSTIPSNFRFARAVYEEGLNHIARFVESFESQSKEIWLVFQNEGLSLSKLIYTVEDKKLSSSNEGNHETANVQVLHPSAWWHWLRTTEAGQREMRNLIRQLLLALKSCHERDITHRDIKPENMIVCFQDVDTGECLREIPSGEKRYNIRMSFGDFGENGSCNAIESTNKL
ncbi:hypothetical protein Taro_012511 [Colocasia esculenta]|uniref:Protein kinase domain-containing protein n=1 Tax=Colocasia esculenta TaxID=4460 RepID=A0A843UD85_COLES|nr:hypothetical protein [Colocasia esculenta]